MYVVSWWWVNTELCIRDWDLKEFYFLFSNFLKSCLDFYKLLSSLENQGSVLSLFQILCHPWQLCTSVSTPFTHTMQPFLALCLQYIWAFSNVLFCLSDGTNPYMDQSCMAWQFYVYYILTKIQFCGHIFNPLVWILQITCCSLIVLLHQCDFFKN